MRKEIYRKLMDVKNVLIGNFTTVKKMLLYLAENGIYIDSICSDQRQYEGIAILNKHIYDISHYRDKSEEFNFIICVNDNEEIEKYKEYLGETNYVTSLEMDFDIYTPQVNTTSIYRMIYDSRTKNLIFMGGGGKQCKQICRILELLDVQIDCIVDDVQEAYLNNEICTYPIWIKPFYELLNRRKGTYKVIVPEEKEKETYKLEELGLELAKDYTDASGYHRFISIPKGLDPILGYNFKVGSRDELPGFVCFGNNKASERIVILGGSTSDATYEPYRSWAEILYDNLTQIGLDVLVYCGACAGYNSSQELNKLIRDVIPIRPNIIISYSGYNDALVKEPIKDNYIKFPYYMYYQIDLMDSFLGYKNETNSNYAITDEYHLGIKHGITRWEQYINNVRTAHAAADEFGILYHCFLQPCLIEKESRWSEYDKELYLNLEKSDTYNINISNFYSNVIHYETPYFHNATNIFDKIDEVYLDECHVNEKGNELIAEHIGKFIQELLNK